VHRLVFNKYYVDEAYQATVVRGVVDGARTLSWVDSRLVDGIVNLCGIIGRLCGFFQGWLDRWFVDGLVNLVGDALVRAGRGLRHLQTGRIQTYLYGALGGALVVVLINFLLP
jgi:NADH-quinone oxidoreductase subunit L